MWLSYENFDNSQATRFSAGFSPSFDYFVLPNLSLGLAFDVGFSDDKGYDAGNNIVEDKTTSFSFGPRLGYNVRLGKAVSFYPRVGAGFTTWSSQESLVTTSPDATAPYVPSPGSSSTGAWVSAFAPLLLHPVPHFFLGIGPTFNHSFVHTTGTASGDPTTVGVGLAFGGYWGGASENHDASGGAPMAAEGAPVAPPAHRFGEAGQWVLDASLDASGSGWWDTAGSSSSSVSVLPGFDYFVADYVSLGANVFFDASQYSNQQQDAVYSTKGSSTGFGLAGHLGVNLPMGRWFSFYPRAYVGFGSYSSSETTAAGIAENASTGEVWVALQAPLLVHPASHFFVGFGPSINHDLANQISYANGYSTSNRATRVSGGLLVGAWL
jgi:hypothetical protein